MEQEVKKLDRNAVAQLLCAGGAMDTLSESYEERPSQVELLKDICTAFNANSIGVFEAGTGVGKSYAYLLPSMLWALDNKERVIVSTGTINLQQQLIEKDIPAAEKIIGREVKAVLIKGRQNFVCMRRLFDAQNEQDLFTDDDEQEELSHIVEWVKNCESGSRSDLSFLPREIVWSRVNSESDSCLGNRCRFFENCFVMKMRKIAAEADILVVNHHLLFADIESRLSGLGYDEAGVLPPYKRLIFDEAHGIETAATSFFSQGITRFSLLKQLGMLYRVKKSAASGHLFTIEALSSEGDVSEAMSAITLIKAHIQDLEETALAVLGEGSTWRLSAKTEVQAQALLPCFGALRGSLTQFCGVVRELIDSIDEKDAEAPAVWETKKILSRLEGAAGVCQQFCEWGDKDGSVFWMEKSRTSNAGVYPRFYVTPLDTSYMMAQGVFEPLDTVVCVSATISIADSFDFWLKTSGASLIEAERLKCKTYPSPFPYKTHMLLAIPTDSPLPDDSQFQPYIEKAIIDLIQKAGGRTLVLFTSYESLRSACHAARLELSRQGVTVLKQGDDDRFRLLEAFKSDTSSVLFATDSFWEGVDVPGESLSQVVLVKLPFGVPTDPVFASRSEAIERNGGSSFMHLSLPQAVIKFRQGAGRLLRTKSDYGVVTVLDRRLLVKQYGSFFIRSIPETKRVFEPMSDMLRSIERFLD